MSSCGLICEFDPLHNGHEYIISKIKHDTGKDVVCLLGGNFTQRGEYAVFDKSLRAKWALSAGASLVLELPYPWSCASAERFASASVRILSSCGICDTLSFGCTCDKDTLLSAAVFLSGEDTESEIKKLQKRERDLSYVRARTAILSSAGFDENLFLDGNNILALEYIRAIKAQNANLEILPYQRIGAAHSGKYTGRFASASYIRENISDEKIREFVPEYVFRDFSKSVSIDEDKYGAALLFSLMSATASELSEIADISDGLDFSIYKNACRAGSFRELVDSLSCKHLTSAKIRRVLIYALLHTTKNELSSLPLFTRILAVADHGGDMITRRTGDLPIISGAKDVKLLRNDAARQFSSANLAEKIFEKFIIAK